MASSGMRKVLRFKYARHRIQKHGNSLCLTKIDLTETSVCTFTIFTSTILTQFLSGITVVPREFEDNGYAKFWELRKVHYGPVKMVNCHVFLTILFVILVVHKYVKSNGDE